MRGGEDSACMDHSPAQETRRLVRLARATAHARLVSRLARARVRGRPHTLSHLVTARCNGHCQTCLWRDPARAELDTKTVTWLYREAGRAGVAQLVVWGGEPLLRQDLPEILLAARRAGLFTTVITNGWFLGERWLELRGLVDALIVSLDDVGPPHDRLRGLPGLYGRLEDFVAAVRCDPLRPTLLVNTVLSSLNRGALERVAPVAARWRAGLYFCPMETGLVTAAGASAPLADLALPADELRAVARSAAALKSAGLPILASRPYLELLARDPELLDYRCRAPVARLTIGADGSVRDCSDSARPLADVRELRAAGEPLARLFELPAYERMLARSASCTKCNNPDVIELSWLWDLRPAMLRKVAELTSL
jgi:MoaA/NifB/PqqE/SkfB family radical SAM enzyme